MLSVDMSGDNCCAEEVDIAYKVAADEHERAAAFRLLYWSYVRSGLIQPNQFEMRVTPYHLLDSTAVFVAALREEVICTVSLVGDCELGLPMEAIYADEIARLRDQGAVLAEVSGLADRRRNMDRFFPVFLRLVGVLCPYARRQGIRQLVVAVHPRHARFYQRFLRFERIGDEKSYPHVCDRPAVALLLDFERLESHWPKVFDLLFGAELTPEELEPRPMSPSERERLHIVANHYGVDFASMLATESSNQPASAG